MSRGAFTAEQTDALLAPIKDHRVYQTPQGHSHVAAYEITAHLSRMFGFGGWDKHIVSLDLIGERVSTDAKDNERFTVAYRCHMRLTIYDGDGVVAKVTEDVAIGDAENQWSFGDAHDMAAKSAVSGALKRCAKDLGDQFGLSLYAKGSTRALVRKIVGVSPVADDEAESEPVVPDAEALDPAAFDADDPGRPFD